MIVVAAQHHIDNEKEHSEYPPQSDFSRDRPNRRPFPARSRPLLPHYMLSLGDFNLPPIHF